MRTFRLNWGQVGAIGDMVLSNLSRLAAYWPLSWRGLSALILGVLLAKWIWILFAPQATFTSAVPERAAGIETGQLFGVPVSTETVSQGVALPNVQLLGVFTASRGRPGFAVLKLDDARQLGVAEGEEVAAGTKLAAVHADHVMLERAGVQQRVNLENKYPASQYQGVLPAHGAAASRQQGNVAPDKNMQNRLRQLRR